MSGIWMDCQRCGRQTPYRKDRQVDGKWTCNGCRPQAMPFADDAWHARAACRDYPEPDDFFSNGSGPLASDGYLRALAVCADCTVRVECLEDALRHTEQHGIWGGFLPDERRKLKRARERKGA